MSDTVRLESAGDGVAVVTLNRPDSLNAMNTEMLAAMPAIFRRVAEDGDVRAVIITGAGRAFSAGGDMKDRGLPTGAPQPGRLSLREAEEASRLLAEMPKPTIAAVNGPAFGAGMSMALAADFRIASEQARMGTAFARMGFSGDFGGTWFLPRLVGPALARELYLLAEPIDAPRMLELGLARAVVAAEQLMPEALALARQLAAGPTVAYGLIKDNLAFSATASLADQLTHEAENMARASATVDHQEAVAAFVEKREPRFRGR
ncbi:MAG: enoyl-CoA hydratase/isomerase family protein [Dehalococcoidia bacterium]|nr:enoyl-CoA hydratase/isomerase family protein [Dehalococcoidia bacterium]